MQINYLQHVPFEGLGSIEPWIRARQYHLTATRLYQDGPLPRMDSIDWLIVMGYIQPPLQLMAAPEAFGIINRFMDGLLTRIEQMAKQTP
jgi:hypothetical protein